MRVIVEVNKYKPAYLNQYVCFKLTNTVLYVNIYVFDDYYQGANSPIRAGGGGKMYPPI